jgi:3-hydroxyacyl-CoA dehydrogenase
MTTETPSPLVQKFGSGLTTTEIVDGVGLVSIDNPPVNALSRDLREAMIDAINHLAAKHDVQSIVLLDRKSVV